MHPPKAPRCILHRGYLREPERWWCWRITITVFVGGNVGAVPFGFFVDTFGKHGVIFIHDGPCCYRCFSNGAIFPDYSYESMDLWILRFLDMPRSEDNHPLDDLRRKPLLHMPTWSAYFPQKRTWKLYMQTLINTASSIIIIISVTIYFGSCINTGSRWIMKVDGVPLI